MGPTRKQWKSIFRIICSSLLVVEEERDRRKRRSKRKICNTIIVSQLTVIVVCAILALIAAKRGKSVLHDVTIVILYAALAALIPSVGIAACMHFNSGRILRNASLPSTSDYRKGEYEDIPGSMNPQICEGTSAELLKDVSNIFEDYAIANLDTHTDRNVVTSDKNTTQLPNVINPLPAENYQLDYYPIDISEPSADPSENTGEDPWVRKMVLYGSWESCTLPGSSRGKTSDSKRYFHTKIFAKKGAKDGDSKNGNAKDEDSS